MSNRTVEYKPKSKALEEINKKKIMAAVIITVAAALLLAAIFFVILFFSNGSVFGDSGRKQVMMLPETVHESDPAEEVTLCGIVYNSIGNSTAVVRSGSFTSAVHEGDKIAGCDLTVEKLTGNSVVLSDHTVLSAAGTGTLREEADVDSYEYTGTLNKISEARKLTRVDSSEFFTGMDSVVSVYFSDAGSMDALSALALSTGYEILYEIGEEKNITLTVENCTVKQAYDNIASILGCTYETDGKLLIFRSGSHNEEDPEAEHYADFLLRNTTADEVIDLFGKLGLETVPEKNEEDEHTVRITGTPEILLSSAKLIRMADAEVPEGEERAVFNLQTQFITVDELSGALFALSLPVGFRIPGSSEYEMYVYVTPAQYSAIVEAKDLFDVNRQLESGTELVEKSVQFARFDLDHTDSETIGRIRENIAKYTGAVFVKRNQSGVRCWLSGNKADLEEAARIVTLLDTDHVPENTMRILSLQWLTAENFAAMIGTLDMPVTAVFDDCTDKLYTFADDDSYYIVSEILSQTDTELNAGKTEMQEGYHLTLKPYPLKTMGFEAALAYLDLCDSKTMNIIISSWENTVVLIGTDAEITQSETALDLYDTEKRIENAVFLKYEPKTVTASQLAYTLNGLSMSGLRAYPAEKSVIVTTDEGMSVFAEDLCKFADKVSGLNECVLASRSGEGAYEEVSVIRSVLIEDHGIDAGKLLVTGNVAGEEEEETYRLLYLISGTKERKAAEKIISELK